VPEQHLTSRLEALYALSILQKGGLLIGMQFGLTLSRA
jgi:hypothetical protein